MMEISSDTFLKSSAGGQGREGVHYPPGITSGRSFQQGKSLMTPLKCFTGSSILIPTCFFL